MSCASIPLYTLPSTRGSALTQFSIALQSAKAYSKNRNFVTATHQNVTRMSPATRHRLVTETELAHLVLAKYKLQETEKLVQEIYWRMYFKGNLEQQPGVWEQWRNSVMGDSHDKFTKRAAEKIESGECDVDVINYFSRELVERGYMHNHARMWFAAYWIHTAKLPWELGAAFFYRHLLDGDAASNTLSWRWVAGIHTPGKAYLARASNIEKYCERALLGDSNTLSVIADGSVRERIPVDQANRSRVQLPSISANLKGFASQPNHRIGLWIHADDLSVDVWLAQPEHAAFLTSQPFIAALCAYPPSLADQYQFSELRRQHITTAFEDAALRMRALTCHLAKPVEENYCDRLIDSLQAFVKKHALTHVIAMRPFVGELWDEAGAIEAALAEHGARVQWLRREEDTALFPSANGGFFNFWQKVSRSFAVKSDIHAQQQTLNF